MLRRLASLSSSAAISSSARDFSTKRRPIDFVVHRGSNRNSSSSSLNNHHLKQLARTASSLSLLSSSTNYQNAQHCIKPSSFSHEKRSIHGTTNSQSKYKDYDELCHIDEKMDKRLIYQYLDLKEFTNDEFHKVFDDIHDSDVLVEGTSADDVKSRDDEEEDGQTTRRRANDGKLKSTGGLYGLEHDDLNRKLDVNVIKEEEKEENIINHKKITSYLLHRIKDIDDKYHISKDSNDNNDDAQKEKIMMDHAREQARLLLNVFPCSSSSSSSSSESNFLISKNDTKITSTISRADFVSHLRTLASTIDSKRTIPISLSMLLVGSSVGIVTPVMPFVVESLGLSAGEYGAVVSAFALAKIVGNVPSAILVERHGRKPYLVYSLSLISLGVGGVGLATCFEHLFCCRLFVGFGVAALSTAATMTIADISTPLNRASTMAPIMSAFAAGTALGPAIGGIMADSIGISPTFYAVGCSYLALTLVNRALLVETKVKPITLPWNENKEKNKARKNEEESVSDAFHNAARQWSILMSDGRVKSVVAMNGFYWFALSGSQMTLLPLLLTDPSGLALSATSVGKVYMGMSLVQVLCNPTLAKFADKMGKEKAIVLGCALISSSMATLPFCTDMSHMACTLGLWSLGSTMLSTAPVAYVSDVVQADKRAQGIALLRTAGDVGFLLGAAGTGAVADWTGNLDIAMQSSAGLLATATSWFVARRFLEKKFEQQS